MVIVSDKFLEVTRAREVQGLLRVVLYLEDMGVASLEEVKAASGQANPRSAALSGNASNNSAPSGNPLED